jgi:phosphonate transport system permease protein
LRRKVATGIILAAVAATLVASYVFTGINPLILWEKRDNAVTYLFGKRLTDQEKDSARREAERLPLLMAQEDIMLDLRQKATAEGRTPDSMALMREAQALAQKRVEAMTAAEKSKVIEEEYERILDKKIGGFFPPETSGSRLAVYGKALLQTVAIAIWGTLLAFLAAVPVSMFAARNTLRLMISGESRAATALRQGTHFAVRRLLDFCRGFNEFVMALIFVAVIGLGPFAGVMSLFIHTFGILGKVFSEAIEAIEPGQVEAVESSGAGPWQIISFSVLPQVMPLLIGFSLYRFESNVRSATILGFVGAGGVGFLMYDKINGYQYREVASMMIMVISSVAVIDFLCGRLRKCFT